MSCNFDSIEEFTALDRLRLPLPNNLPPVWKLHVVQLRPGAGDRVFGFYGAATQTASFTGGCFALGPEDALSLACDTANWCHGAWPLLRHVPGPHRWTEVSPALNQFVTQLGLFQLQDIRMVPWSTEAWYIRYDDGPHTLRHFGWFARGDAVSSAWLNLQKHCIRVAEQSLRATPSRRP